MTCAYAICCARACPPTTAVRAGCHERPGLRSHFLSVTSIDARLQARIPRRLLTSRQDDLRTDQKPASRIGNCANRWKSALGLIPHTPTNFAQDMAELTLPSPNGPRQC